MEEVLREWAGSALRLIASMIGAAAEYVGSLNPTQKAVMWVQLAAGAASIFWIILQIAAWRRLNEARIERYIEDRIDREREDLAREREDTLARLDRVVARRGIRRRLMLVWAHIVLTVSFVLRMLSLDTIKGLSNHSMLLLQVGKARRARRVYLDVATDTTKRIRRYEEALSNAKLEAQNALLFAGRVAVIEDRPAAATAAFRKVLSLKDDPDARLLVARQMMRHDMAGALQHVDHALAMPLDGKPQVRSELYRCKAAILFEQKANGRALAALKSAREIDDPIRNYLGLGFSEEMRGDAYAGRPRYRNAAVVAYEASIAHFERANDKVRKKKVDRKLAELKGDSQAPVDSLWTRWLDRRAQRLLRRVEKRRVRARSKAS